VRLQAVSAPVFDLRSKRNLLWQQKVVDFSQAQTTNSGGEVKMLGANKITDLQPTIYATHADFCRIFAEEMTPLYLLSFLLTGDHAQAEKCFVQGLDDSGKGNRVFKEWAESWARRTIIQNAIQMTQPRPGDGGNASEGGPAPEIEPAELAAVATLPNFDRFVYVMSVLERYSNQECSLLLGCSRNEVIAARARALQQVGNSVQLRWKLHEPGQKTDLKTKDLKTKKDERESALKLSNFLHLPITA
jgi:DNA-directed RNA polymerase specialized sigma24 family protein